MKMADKYLHFETNNLRPLCEHLFGAWEPKTWGHMGTTATAINLDDIDGGNQIQIDTTNDGKVNEYHYLLPIIDEVQANTFRVECAKLGVQVEIMTHVEALAKWEELKALRPQKATV